MTRILVFDSGVGGLSAVQAIRRTLPHVGIVYLADLAGFPYGEWPADPLADRVMATIGRALNDVTVDAVVVACNTATTVALDRLRSVNGLPIVGTVPGIKPAVAATKTGVIGLLATSGTIGRSYTDKLVRDFASDVTVIPVGSPYLARFAEDRLRGRDVDLGAIAAELAPLFDRTGAPVDTVVLGCTHYPLLLDGLKAATPRPVTWIDTGPAIAEQTARVLAGRPGGKAMPDIALVASDANDDVSSHDTAMFRRFGFENTSTLLSD